MTALSGVTVSAPFRIGVEIHFRLTPAQVGHLAPDLDNLIKATVDALDDVIGQRDFKGRRQADEERFDLILALKGQALAQLYWRDRYAGNDAYTTQGATACG